VCHFAFGVPSHRGELMKPTTPWAPMGAAIEIKNQPLAKRSR
jgi:hypothetical protein